MSTIFDYNPTPDELEAIGFDSLVTLSALSYIGTMTREVYLERVPLDKAILDIAILHEHRGQDASSFWAQIPDLHDQYVRGFDYELVSL